MRYLVRWSHRPAFDIEQVAITSLKQLLLGWREVLDQDTDTPSRAVHEADENTRLLETLEVIFDYSPDCFRVTAVKVGRRLQLAELAVTRPALRLIAVRRAAADVERCGSYREQWQEACLRANQAQTPPPGSL